MSARGEVRSGAERVSSLAYTSLNRNNRPIGRGRNCARFSLRGIDLRTPGPDKGTIYRRLNCNRWDCSYCGPRKQKLYRRAIGCWAESLQLQRFLTLTLDPEKFLPGISFAEFLELHDDDEEKQRLKKLAVKHLRQCFDKLRVYLGRKYGAGIRYICVLEFHESGMPHLHLLVDRYIPVGWIRVTWQKAGGGHHVWIEQVAVRRCAAYISKYLGKQLTMRVPHRTRRITCSRSIQLLAPLAGPKHRQWELLKQNIWTLWEMLAEILPGEQRDLFRVLGSGADEQGYLEWFSLVDSPPGIGGV